MKPANFPDRKNKRRMIALSHLPNLSNERNEKKRLEEEQSLQARINPYGLRHVRTKINRGTI